MIPPASTTVLLTGLPRSGTTLLCALLNECHDTVALAEPLRLERHGDRERAVGEIDAFVARIRRQILAHGEVETLHVGGAVPDNWLTEPTDALGRRSLAEWGTIRVERPLSPDFRLIVKHPGEFSALAGLLDRRYPLVALIRHPLAVLASWQTVHLPVNDGHLPMGEVFNPDLAATLAAVPDRLERQVALLGWLLSTYATLRPHQILRYEDVVADPAATLATTFGVRPGAALRALSEHDPARRYPGVDLRPLATALMAIRPLCERFYPDFGQSLRRVIADGAGRG